MPIATVRIELEIQVRYTDRANLEDKLREYDYTISDRTIVPDTCRVTAVRDEATGEAFHFPPEVTG